MSRTNKTRPLKVRMLDPKDTHVDYREVHNHINRECDLPPKDDVKALENTVFDSTRTSCHYSFVYNGHNLCGCKMCTDQIARHQDIKKSRAEGKKETRQELKEVNSSF